MPSSSTNGKIQRPPKGEIGAVAADVRWDSIFAHDQMPVVGSPSPVELERMIVRDSQIRSLQNALTLPIRSQKYYIEPADDDSGEAEFAEEALLTPAYEGGMTTPMDQVVAQSTKAITHRVAYFEKVFKEDKEGRDVYHKLAYRRPSTCFVIPDKNGSFNGFAQQGFDTAGRWFEVEYSPNKSYVYIHGNDADNPLRGESALESAYQDWQNKLKVSLLRYMYLQKFGLPVVVGRLDAGSPIEQEKYAKKLRKAQGGAILVLGPSEGVVDQAIGATSNVQDFQATIDYLDTQMARSVNYQQQQLSTTSSSHTGSFALANTFNDFFLLGREADQKEIQCAITNHVLAPLIYYNFGPDAAFPKFCFEPLRDDKREMVLELVKSLWERQVSVPRPEVLDAIEKISIQFLGLEVEPPGGETYLPPTDAPAREDAPEDGSATPPPDNPPEGDTKQPRRSRGLPSSSTGGGRRPINTQPTAIVGGTYR